MKDSQGREISLSRLDMLTDDEIDQLKGDSWDDYCWKSGNQYARMVHEFCVIEQDKRIRKAEEAKIKAIRLEIELAQNKEKAKVERELRKLIIETRNRMETVNELEAEKPIVESAEKDTTIVYHGTMP